MTNMVFKEAAKLMKENPGMKHYEALIEAKKIVKEKAREDSNEDR